MNKTRLLAGVLGVLMVGFFFGTCWMQPAVRSDITAEQLHLVDTQLDALHEQIAASRRTDTWTMLAFAVSVLTPVSLAVLLIYQADRSALGRDEIFHEAVRHRLTPELVHAALALQELKKKPTLSDRLARQIRLIKRWQEHRPALPSADRRTNDDEEADHLRPSLMISTTILKGESR